MHKEYDREKTVRVKREREFTIESTGHEDESEVTFISEQPSKRMRRQPRESETIIDLEV